LDNLDPIKEMQQSVAWAAKYYPVGLMTNIMPGQIKAMIERGILPDIAYQAIVDSSEIGTIKPEAAMYEKSVELAGCKPHEILLIDDIPANLMAAERMGWRVLWFDDYRPADTEALIKQSLEF
jgi:putative hydrolase of the HAD superfamily